MAYLDIFILCAFVACARAGMQRIEGGKNVKATDIIDAVSIQYRDRHRCSGAIVKPNWVVTTAFCVSGLSTSDVKVKTDHRNLERATSYYVLQIKLHPSYVKSTRNFDVAVVRVAEAAWTGYLVLGPAKLKPNAKVTLYGWGGSKASSAPSNILKYAELTVLNINKCKLKLTITDRNFCTMDSGKYACNGDEGAPVTAETAVGLKLAGIMSWGRTCFNETYPTVFTILAHPDIKSFINSNAKP